jgi:hypothetical protein
MQRWVQQLVNNKLMKIFIINRVLQLFSSAMKIYRSVRQHFPKLLVVAEHQVLLWDNTPLFRKKSPVIKIYFPGNDTPTTNEGFSPSVVVVCHFQGRKFL